MILFQVLTIFSCLQLHVISVLGKWFSIEKNVNITEIDLSLSIDHVTGVTLGACTVSCSAKLNCVSAIFHIDTLNCHLFSSCKDIQTTLDSSYAYLEINPNIDKTLSLYIDCQEAFENGETQSGVFNLYQPQYNNNMTAWCDFDGVQGWTVIQRRLDGSVDFHRDWNSYENGFGHVKGEYWLGLENIYYLTRENRNLSIFFEAHDGQARTANYTTFYVEHPDYTLTVSGYSGDAGDSFNNGRRFTTIDRDNDNSAWNCAELFMGAWWYGNCGMSDLNGLWSAGGHMSEYGDGAYWNSWKGGSYSYKTIVMRVGR